MNCDRKLLQNSIAERKIYSSAYIMRLFYLFSLVISLNIYNIILCQVLQNFIVVGFCRSMISFG